MGRVGVVYPRANLDTVPSLVGVIEALAKRGYEVDVFTRSIAGQDEPAFSSPNVHLLSLGVEGLAERATAGLRGAVRCVGWLPPVARAPLARAYASVSTTLADGSRLLAQLRTRTVHRYDCMIGVDPDGLLLASELAHGAPVAYYSLELLLSEELTSMADARLKGAELQLSQEAPFVIVQDEARGKLLAKDNSLPWQRLVLVPNSPRGPARRWPGRYWHGFFDLPAESRVVLHSGSLGDWTGIESIVASAPEWPSPWVLVVHTRYDAESSPYVEALRARADPGRVRFSLKPVPRQAYDDLIDGADVGIAFYVPSDASTYTQRNIQVIGLSSGKLAYYLRSGLPVLVNRAASIAEQVEAWGCGVAVENAAQLPDALAWLAHDYARYSAASCAFFEKHMDVHRGFREVLERVDVLARRG